MSYSLKDSYLILYNALCCLGWLQVWGLAVLMVGTGVFIDQMPLPEALSNVYFAQGLATCLIVSQTSALLEMGHAVTGIVRSPVLVTTMQVMSRIVALVALVYSTDAQCESLNRIIIWCLYGLI